MVTRALQKYLKISSKKLAIVARMVRGKKVNEALFILVNMNKKGAGMLKCAVESALNNAKKIPEKKFGEENLYISKVTVNMGPALKRFRSMSMGRAGLVLKRTSHVLVELDATETAAKSPQPEKAKATKNFAKSRKK
ncbi:MAG: 50S ribosomal protein L22 [Candidatus Omnitrophica bacterium]|nr:50S ribosomal protein L22 [Candidatus Omnitrophota bacterium]